MIFHYKRGYPTTVELYSNRFWDLYITLQEIRGVFLKARSAEPNYVIPFAMEVSGRKLYSSSIFEAFTALEDYRLTKGITDAERDAEIKKRERYDVLPPEPESDIDYSVDFLLQNQVKHSLTMEFKLWECVLPLIGAFEMPEDDSTGESDDWMPPNNFQNGTDDEREVWEEFHKRP